MRKKMTYAEVIVDDCLKPAIANLDEIKGKKLPVVLVANTHRVVIRIAELSGRDKRLSPMIQWRLVQDNYPLGPLLNEETHIFDGSVFENSTGRCCFMMAALPKAVAESVGEMGTEHWGSANKLVRLETIEHLLFRRYADAASIVSNDEESIANKWIVFSQDDGFRILHIDDGLPQGAYYISNHPEMRMGELDQVWDAAKPSYVTILTRLPNKGEDDDSLDTPDPKEWSKYLWIWEFIQGKGVVVDYGELML